MYKVYNCHTHDHVGGSFLSMEEAHKHFSKEYVNKKGWTEVSFTNHNILNKNFGILIFSYGLIEHKLEIYPISD